MSENLTANHDRAPTGRPTGAVFNHPDEVLADTGLTPDEKRAVLASWASDACSIESAPALRRLESGAIVSLADILAALTALDGTDAARRATHRSGGGRRAIRLQTRRPLPRSIHRHDDDDDPPPSPAAARPWVPVPVLNARAA